MSFYNQFRTAFRKTREFVKTGDNKGAALGCRELADLIKTQHAIAQGIRNRAKWKTYEVEFTLFADSIVSNSLIDSNIRAYFGVPVDTEKNKPEINESSESPVHCEVKAEKIIPAVIDDIDPIDALVLNKSRRESTGTDNIKTDIEGTEPINEVTEVNGITIPDDATFTPKSLDGLVGQQEIKQRVNAEIGAARKQGNNHIDHILLLGSRGLGKTTLMELIAKALGVPFEHLDCTQFRNDVSSQRALQNFFHKIGKRNGPVVIGMDELHSLPPKLQAGLLTLLNNREYIYMDNNGTNQIIPIKEFTFIGATTDPHELLPTLKDRCSNLTFYLKDYSRDELQRIFLGKFASKGLQVNDDALGECISRCRSSVREVNSIVNGLCTLAINADTKQIDTSMVNEYFKNAEIDPIGLRVKDLEILNILYEEPSGIMAEETIAAKAGIDLRVYKSEYEPYLIKIGFISITGRGRALSEKAKTYLSDMTQDDKDVDVKN